MFSSGGTLSNFLTATNIEVSVGEVMLYGIEALKGRQLIVLLIIQFFESMLPDMVILHYLGLVFIILFSGQLA